MVAKILIFLNPLHLFLYSDAIPIGYTLIVLMLFDAGSLTADQLNICILLS